MSRCLSLGVLLLASSLVAAAPVPKSPEQLGPTTKEELRTGKKRMQALVLAAITYADEHNGKWPTNVTDEKGKTLLSWRVRLLPYLGQKELFEKFDLTDAWDGKTNRKLVEQMPDCFAPARNVTKEQGVTFCQGFDGPGAAFEAGKPLRFPASFPDGTSQTIALVEAGEPVTWTKPADVAFDPKGDQPKLGGVYDGEFWVGMCDGSAYLAVTKHIDFEQFQRAVTTADGYVLDLEAALGRSPKRK